MVKYELDLFSNAISSLDESLRQYRQHTEGKVDSLKFAILNLGHFIELLLKHLVSEQHKLLVFKEPAKKGINEENSLTITTEHSINILENCDIKVPDSLQKDIKTLREKRNAIMHYKVKIDTDEFVELIGCLLADITVWDSGNLKHRVNISDHVSPENWKLIAQTVKDEERKIMLAEESAIRFNGEHSFNLIDSCPECGHLTIYLKADEDGLCCSYCSFEDQGQECEHCNVIYPIGESYPKGDGRSYFDLCTDCYEAMVRADMEEEYRYEMWKAGR